MTHTPRHTSASGCNLGVVQESRNRQIRENPCQDWCARLGSNQQPLPSEGSTLSIELRARMTEGTAFHIQNNGGRAAASPKQYLFSADPSTARTRPTDIPTPKHPRQQRRNSG